MTPLAMLLAKRFLVEKGRDTTLLAENDEHRARLSAVVRSLPETQCFEITNAVDLIAEFAREHFPHHVDDRLMFWPHQNCWFEILGEGRSRAAIVVRSLGGARDPAMVRIISSRWVSVSDEAVVLSEEMKLAPGGLPGGVPDIDPEGARWLGANLAAILTAINQPKVIGRQVRHAHRGLERKLSQARVGTRRTPLPDIVTLDLEAFVTREADDGPESGGVAGSKKCFHFVRAHIRQANGQFVRSHWRGDPALGVGRKNYRVVPPKRPASALSH